MDAGAPRHVRTNRHRRLPHRQQLGPLPLVLGVRMAIYAFPVLALAFYAVLRRFGPLRRTAPRPAQGPIELREPAPAAVTAPSPLASRLGIIPRLALPLGVVVVAAGTRSGHLRA